MMSVPAISAVSAKNMPKITPPRASEYIICADNDANGVGQRAGRQLAARLVGIGHRVRIAIPPRPDTDWNDVLLEHSLKGDRDGGASGVAAQNAKVDAAGRLMDATLVSVEEGKISEAAQIPCPGAFAGGEWARIVNAIWFASRGSMVAHVGVTWRGYMSGTRH
jgi:hypothetical protein